MLCRRDRDPSASAWPAAAPAQSAGGNDAAKPVAIASLLTQPSMNVFRRFTVDRAKVLEFYGDVLGLKALPPIGMAGGNQMSRFQVGTSEIKLTGSTPGRQDKSGAVRDTTGLRVFTFFFPDEAALTARFTSHGLPAPAFKAREGGTRGAMVLDPDSQWVELVVAPGAPPETFSQLEVGLTVSDLDEEPRVLPRVRRPRRTEAGGIRDARRHQVSVPPRHHDGERVVVRHGPAREHLHGRHSVRHLGRRARGCARQRRRA